MTDGLARRHAGTDEAPRRRGDSRDRRHGPGARRLQRRQAGLRRRARQRAVLHRAHRPTSPRRRATSSSARRFDNGVLCSSPNSVVVDRAVADEVQARVHATGRAFPVAGGSRQARGRCSSRRSGCRIRSSSASRAQFIAEQVGITVPPNTRVLIAELKGVGRDYPALDREALPGALVLRRRRLARRLRALHPDPALRRHGPHHVDPLAERRRSFSSSA